MLVAEAQARAGVGEEAEEGPPKRDEIEVGVLDAAVLTPPTEGEGDVLPNVMGREAGFGAVESKMIERERNTGGELGATVDVEELPVTEV